MLSEHYDKAPIIIIDEYDTPIQEGYSKEFYDEIIGFMRNFFSGAFKDNRNLSYGFLIGILRISQESIFSGLNNLMVNSVMDEAYNSFFGFTESEVKDMLEYYRVSDKENEANIYRLLLDAGYLKIFDKKLQGDGTWLCNAKIPNREIFTIYKSEIVTHVDK